MTRRIDTIELGPAGVGTQHHLTVHRFGPTTARRKAYLQASLHADEPPGGLVLHHLSRMLGDADVLEHIILVPAANPIGLTQYHSGRHSGRYDGFTASNFNRGYPDISARVQSLVEGRLGDDEAVNTDAVRDAMRQATAELSGQTRLDHLRIALMRLAAEAEIVLDLHCDREAELYIYLGGDLWPDGRDLSADLGATATLLAIDSGGGSFDEAFSKVWWDLKERFGDTAAVAKGCLSATLELRGPRDVSDDIAQRDAAGLFHFLQRRGFVGGTAPALPPLIAEATELTACESLRSPAAGILVFHRDLGDGVEKGDLIAEVIDQTAAPETERTAITAGTSGRLFSRTDQRWVQPGQNIAKIAGTKPLPNRGPYLLSD